MQGSYVLWQWKMMQNLNRNWLASSTLTSGIDELWSKHSKISKTCTLMGCFWPKYMFELKKYRGVMFDGTEDWFKIWRKTDLWFQKWHEKFGKFSPEHSKFSKLVFWWDLFRAIEILKIGFLMGSFYPKWKMYDLEIYREVMCHDNEEWCRIWIGIDLSIQNWHEKFDEF